MLIIFDVGNSSVTYGTYDGGRLHSFGSINYDLIPKFIDKCTKSGAFGNNNYLVISSVVPKIIQKVKNCVRRYPRMKLLEVGRDIPICIKHKYRNYNKLGIDRIVNIYGATRIFKPPFLIMDFGSAITADYVSAKSVFEGGMIIPGPEVAFQALIKKAVLLPKSLKMPVSRKSFLGRTTKDCLTSGILEGYGSMADELIRRFKHRFGNQIRVIATGGLATVLKPYTLGFDIVDPRHSVKSLLILFKDFRAAK